MSYCIVKRSRPSFITYQYQNKLVFVTPASDYEQALDLAQREFPKLKDIPRDRIIFSVSVLHQESNSRQSIRISPEAWAATIDKALPGQVVIIDTLPTPAKKFWNFKRGKSEEPDSLTGTPQKEVDSTSSSTLG